MDRVENLHAQLDEIGDQRAHVTTGKECCALSILGGSFFRTLTDSSNFQDHFNRAGVFLVNLLEGSGNVVDWAEVGDQYIRV